MLPCLEWIAPRVSTRGLDDGYIMLDLSYSPSWKLAHPASTAAVLKPTREYFIASMQESHVPGKSNLRLRV